jgi:YwiC-like protein
MKLADPMEVCARALPPRVRSLVPREHGAFGEMAMPMAAALAGGRPGPAALLLATSAWAFFLAHEPALVLLGRRGERVRIEERGRAVRRLAGLGVAGMAFGAAGLLLADPSVRWAVLGVVLLACGFSAVVAARRERTAAGELLAAMTLAAVAFPVGVAAGLSAPTAGRAWLVWSIGLAALVPPVRSIGARRRASASAVNRILPAVLGLGLGIGLQGSVFTPVELVALAPLLVGSAWLGLVPPDPRQLRRVGWTLVGAMLLTATILGLAPRVGG